jgi:thymidylate kinase
VYEGYLKILESEGDRFISIEPTGSIEDTHQKIVSELKQRGIF